MAGLTTEYLWMVIVGFIFGFGYAFGIGANDVANAFGSSVASKSLTLKQAIIAAGIFEFLGAVLLGAGVTNTIRNKIFDPDLYIGQEDVVFLGMFTSMITGTIMLNGATYFGLPVSTTHTIVGCIMGFSIVAKGFDSIDWDTARTIFMSWIISPLASGVAAFIFFATIKYTVMISDNSFQRAYYTFPIILTIFIGVDLFYVLYKGFNNKDFAEDFTLKNVLPSSFAVGVVCGLIWLFVAGPIAMKRAIKHVDEEEAKAADTEKKAATDEEVGIDRKEEENDGENDEEHDEDVMIANKTVEAPETPEQAVPEEQKRGMLQTFADKTYRQDLHAQSMSESQRAAEIWDEYIQYDPKTEQLFTYVQFFTACLNSFAHGANDVANAIAPLSAMLLIYRTGEIKSKSPVETWILAYGGIGIVLGLLIFGYRVMKSIGYKLTGLSPSRGACAELAASLFVVTASYMEIPVSSTQSIIGAVFGVGLVGGVKNVQWLFFLRVCVGWVMVFAVAVVLNAGIFSMFAFTPKI